jgi:sugar phosphate permease
VNSPPPSTALKEATRIAGLRLVPLLALGYVVSYIDRANVGFAALTMNHDLGLTASQFGFAAGTFYIGYCLLEVPSNLALRRFGARRWLARIMVSWGIAAAGTAFATGPVSFSVFRVITGACEAGFYPGVIYYLATWFPAAVRGRVFGWFIVANPISSVISAPVSTALLHMDGTLGVAGWRWLLICEGLPACLLGVYTLFALPDTPRDARWLTDEQKDALEQSLATEQPPGVVTRLAQALRDPRLLILAFSYFCLVVGILGVTLWFPQMLRQQGLSTNQIGVAAAFPFVLSSIGMILWSYRVDRTRAYFGNYVSGCVVGAVGCALSVSADSLPLLLTGISIGLIGMNIARPALFCVLPAFVHGRGAAAGIAVVNSIGNLGGLFGPYLMGWLKDTTGSFRAGVLGLAAVLALGALSAPLIRLIKR